MDEEGAGKSFQAYQVIGHLMVEPDNVSEAERIRAMDYFSNEEAYDEDFLPWPR